MESPSVKKIERLLDSEEEAYLLSQLGSSSLLELPLLVKSEQSDDSDELQNTMGDNKINSTTEDKVVRSVGSPCQTGITPSFEEFGGKFNFDISVPAGDHKLFCFSKQLHKIFVKTEKKVPVDFSMDFEAAVRSKLNIRAMMTFTKAEYISQPVIRCLSHEMTNKNDPLVSHVFCSVDNLNASYFKDDTSNRFSVVVPVERPQPGTNTFREMYKSMCKNSCICGINRRDTRIIFTLEKSNEVVGRRVVSIRSCSSPKRDMEKEEQKTRNELEKNMQAQKRVASDGEQQNKPKKPKVQMNVTEDSDDEFCITFKVKGLERLQEIMAVLARTSDKIDVSKLN